MNAQLSLLLCLAAAPVCAEDIKVNDSDARFSRQIKITHDGARYDLKITGAGLMEKMFINVFAIASYRDASVKVNGVAALIHADIAKRLLLRMERDVNGETMYGALEGKIFDNGGEGKFGEELKLFKAYFSKNNPKEGQYIIFDHVPGQGLSIKINHAAPTLIRGVRFAKTFWKIWMGSDPISADLKASITEKI